MGELFAVKVQQIFIQNGVLMEKALSTYLTKKMIILVKPVYFFLMLRLQRKRKSNLGLAQLQHGMQMAILFIIQKSQNIRTRTFSG